MKPVPKHVYVVLQDGSPVGTVGANSLEEAKIKLDNSHAQRISGGLTVGSEIKPKKIRR